MNRLLMAGCVSLVGLAGCAMQSESTDSSNLGTQVLGLDGWQYIQSVPRFAPPDAPYLDVQGGGTGNGTPVWTWPFNGTPAQQWYYSATSRTFTNASGKCLDVQGAGTADGTPVWIWECNGTDAQAWLWYRGGQLRNDNSGLCLTIPADNPEGTLQVSFCHAAYNQLWAPKAI